MKKLLGVLCAVALAFVLASASAAQQPQQQPQQTPPTASAPQAAAPTEIGVKAEFLRQFDAAATKLTRLAEAMPAENYGWRPMEGVRSVSEVFMHVAGGCYGFARTLGTPMPEGVDPRQLREITDKAQVTEELKKALTHMRGTAEKLNEADMTKEVQFRRRQAATREVLMAIAVHLHEHLGQSIAYARSNKVVPPWSAGN